MKRFHLLLISCFFVATSFAQGYSERQLESVLDSVSTNPEYVLRWADGAIAQNAKCADAYFVKSFVYIAQEDYLQALELINTSLRHVSKKSVFTKPFVLCTRGAIYEHVEDDSLALADYTEAIAISPKEIEAYECRINLYKDLLQYDKAEEDCRALLAIKDSLAYKLELVSVLTYQEKTDEALEILNKIIKYQPKQVRPYASRSWVNYLIGNGQGAISDYITFMALDGDYSLDYLVAYSRLDYAYAVSALSSMIASDSENGMWISARIRVHVAQEEYDLALTDLDACETAFGQSPFIYYQRALCYQGLYEYTNQIESLNTLIGLVEEEDEDLYTMRAIAQRNAGDTDAALADFNKALQINPTSANALAERAWTKDMLYKDKEAIKDYTAAITYAEPNAWIHIQRGRMYQTTGDSVKAKADFELALQLDTTSSTHAFALLHLGRTLPAINFMKAIIAENPNDVGEHYDLACLYSLANMKTEAIEALKRAIELGYKAYNHIKLDRDLTNIREEQAYKNLLNNITKSKVSRMLEGFAK